MLMERISPRSEVIRAIVFRIAHVVGNSNDAAVNRHGS